MDVLFSPYKSKPITRFAHKITEDDTFPLVAPCAHLLNGKEFFKADEPVNVGDYVIKIDDTDIYHCTAEVFADRNIIPRSQERKE